MSAPAAASAFSADGGGGEGSEGRAGFFQMFSFDKVADKIAGIKDRHQLAPAAPRRAETVGEQIAGIRERHDLHTEDTTAERIAGARQRHNVVSLEDQIAEIRGRHQLLGAGEKERKSARGGGPERSPPPSREGSRHSPRTPSPPAATKHGAAESLPSSASFDEQQTAAEQLGELGLPTRLRRCIHQLGFDAAGALQLDALTALTKADFFLTALMNRARVWLRHVD